MFAKGEIEPVPPLGERTLTGSHVARLSGVIREGGVNPSRRAARAHKIEESMAPTCVYSAIHQRPPMRKEFLLPTGFASRRNRLDWVIAKSGGLDQT
jgi:hypothetical protein